MGSRRNARVELLLAGTWTDVTGYTYERDPITISRGRSAEASTADPSKLTLTLDNRDGRFSPRNPASPYYGVLGRNTQIRVSIPGTAPGERRYRFYGEVSAWPQSWDVAGRDGHVKLTAWGRRRRLTLNAPPLRSTMYREHTHPSRKNIVAYWPMEDAEGATQLASSSPGVRPISIRGSVKPGSYGDWTASDPMVTLDTGTLVATVPPYTPTGEVSIRMFAFVPAAPPSDLALMTVETTGSVTGWELALTPAGGIRTLITSHDGTLLSNAEVAFKMTTRGFTLVGLELRQIGADISWRVVVTDFTNTRTMWDAISTPSTSGTLTGQSLGIPRVVTVGRSGGLGNTVAGHLAVGDSIGAYAQTGPAISAWNGEAADKRIKRLCAEENIPFVLVDKGVSAPNPVSLGDQRNEALADVLDEAAETDLGILAESRDALALLYRTRPSLVNQSPAVTLDYSAGQIAGVLEPVDDDASVLNDVTVTRADGSSRRVVQVDGPMSVLAPPAGVGRYPYEVTVSLEKDAQLYDQAYWRLHMGTVDEARFPRLSVDLHSPNISAGMAASLLTLDVGDRLDITGIGEGLPPDDVAQLVDGYSETIRMYEHTITYNLSPESPWRAGVVGDAVLGRADGPGSTLVGPLGEAPGFVDAKPVYVNAAAVTVPIPAGETIVAVLAWNTAEAVTVPAGWTLRRSLVGASSRAEIYTASAGVASSTFTVTAAAKFSGVALGYEASTVLAHDGLLDSVSGGVHEAPALAVAQAPATLVRFYWDKTSGTTTFTRDDPTAATRGVQYGTGVGSCAVLATDQTVTSAGTVPQATATANVTTTQAGGFSIALVSQAVTPSVAATSTTLQVVSGRAFEDFEDDVLSISAVGNWTRTNAQAHTGTWSLRSNAVADLGTTDYAITVPPGATSLTFWYKVSSEAVVDVFTVLADSFPVLEDSGIGVWVKATVDVTDMTTVTFRYSKDVSDTAGDDAVYVDEIGFDMGPLWATSPADMPVDITVGGERMTVTAVAGTTNPQIFTVIRSVNGVVKTQAVGTGVRLAQSANAAY